MRIQDLGFEEFSIGKIRKENKPCISKLQAGKLYLTRQFSYKTVKQASPMFLGKM